MDMTVSWRIALIAMCFLATLLAPASGMDVLNPSFTLRDILPAGMASVPGIGGIDLLPNGDGVICAWGGSQKSNGEVWIVPALATGNPGAPSRIATGLREALGVAVVGNDFYVVEKPRILKFTGSGANWNQSTLFTLGAAWYDDLRWMHFSFNLIHHDNALWFTTSTNYPFDPYDPLQRGSLMRVPLDGSGYKQMARGLNTASGLGLGPEGEFFVTDDQGTWKPTNVLYRIPVKGELPANGRFYGSRRTTNNACSLKPPAVDGSNCPADPEYPPAVWIPYSPYSCSPTRPLLLKAGPYAGQMISGDVTRGGVLRYQVEKVKGEWQGAVFSFQDPGPAGIDFGIYQFLYTPSGSLLVAGIGGGAEGLGGESNWNRKGTVRGLNLLTPTTAPVFDLLAIRSLRDGFDVEFTQPASSAAGDPANWSVKTTVFTPMQEFGGDSLRTDNNVPVEVVSAILSPDGRHVHLKPASLLTRRMYAIQVNGVVSAAGGQDLYSKAGYYTLNAVSDDSGSATRLAGPAGDFRRRMHASMHQGRVAFDLPFLGHWEIDLLRPDGARIARAAGAGPGRFGSPSLPPGMYLVVGRAEGAVFGEKVLVR
jgi:hypothetical protein